MMSKRLALVDVGDVYFYQGQSDAEKGVTQGDTGMTVPTRIDDGDLASFGRGRVYAIDQCTLTIALEEVDTDSQFQSLPGQLRFDIGQSHGAISFRLTGT